MTTNIALAIVCAMSCLLLTVLAPFGAEGAKPYTEQSNDDNSYNFTIGLWEENSLVTLGGSTEFDYNYMERNGHHHSKSVILTPGFQTYSAGRATFYTPIPFWKPKTNTGYSFTTTFTFSIKPPKFGLSGDGFAFFIDTDSGIEVPATYAGGLLGLYSNHSKVSGDSHVRVLAVEFDTFENPEFKDINSNHVGLDIQSVISTASIDLGLFNIQLDSGKLITALIDFDAGSEVLNVYLAYGRTAVRGKSARVLSAYFPLAKFASKNPTTYVGFSAGTGSQAEIVSIHSWEFQSWQSSVVEI